MGDPFCKAISGQPVRVPAQTWNAFLDAARAHRDRQEDVGREARPLGNSGIVLVKNATGADVGRFGVLGIDDVLITPGDNEAEFLSRTALTGVTPTADHRGRFVVLLEPLRAGALGRAVVTGPAPVQVNVNHEDHGWADVKDGDATQLESAHTGAARILWKESGTGTKWAVVLLAQTAASNELDAQITGGDQASGFTWEEAEYTSGGGSGIKTGGRTSATDGVAYLTNDVVNADAIVDAFVRLRSVALAGGGTEWRFDPPWPVPENEYEVVEAREDADSGLRWRPDDVRTP